MSKLVNWGHWVAAGALAARGLRELFLARIEPSEFGYHLSGAFFFLLPAIGILFWNRLAPAVAIAVCGFNFARSFNGPFAPDSHATRVALGVTLGLVLLWLIAPGVRRQFRGGTTS